MRKVLPFAFLCLLACGGDAEEECVEPQVNLIVTVLDNQDQPISGAEVTIDNRPCKELGDGDYECVVRRYANNIHVFGSKLPDYRPAAVFVEVWEPDECDVFEEYVELRLSSYIGGN